MNLQTKILGSLSSGVVVLDEALHIIYLNESAELLIGSSSKHVFGKALQDFIHSAERGNGYDEILNVCKKSLNEHIDLKLRDCEIFVSSGSSERVDCLINYLKMGAGDECNLLLELIIKDNSHIKVEELNRASINQCMIRGLAHEIRNPLGGIRGAAQLLASDLEISSHNSDVNQYTNVIIREVDRLNHLVSQMQSSTRADDRENLNIHSVLEHVRKLKQSVSSKISILTDYDPSLPEIFADADQLIQTFINITQNAQDAIEQHGGVGKICIKTRIDHQLLPGIEQKQQVIRIDVTDNGVGISKAMISHIFEPMVTDKSTGAGLGLSICEEIIRSHGGRISVASEVGNSTFSVYLSPIRDSKGKKNE